MDRDRLARALDLAVTAVTAPRARILATFRSPALQAEAKADGSPVTAADRDAERIVRETLRASAEFGALPDSGRGGRVSTAPRRRTAGSSTRSTVPARTPAACPRSARSWRSRRARAGGRSSARSISRQAGETVSAARGVGAFRDGVAVSASRADRLDDAIISAPDLAQFREAGCPELYTRLHGSYERVRGYTDCWAHVQAVGGAVDVVVEPGLSPWDIRATQVLIEEAGGKQLVRPSRAAGKVDTIFRKPCGWWTSWPRACGLTPYDLADTSPRSPPSVR